MGIFTILGIAVLVAPSYRLPPQLFYKLESGATEVAMSQKKKKVFGKIDVSVSSLSPTVGVPRQLPPQRLATLESNL
jgi:hypothetical protein